MTFATDKAATLLRLPGGIEVEIFTGSSSITGNSTTTKGTVWENTGDNMLVARKLRSRAEVANVAHEFVIGLYEVAADGSSNEILDVLYDENLGTGFSGDTIFESTDINVAVPVGRFAVCITNLDDAMASKFGSASAIPSPLDVTHITSANGAVSLPPEVGDTLGDAGTDGYANHVVLSSRLYPLTDWT